MGKAEKNTKEKKDPGTLQLRKGSKSAQCGKNMRLIERKNRES